MSTWITEVKSVQKELGCSYKEAMVEASKRRKTGGSTLGELGRERGIKLDQPIDRQGLYQQTGQGAFYGSGAIGSEGGSALGEMAQKYGLKVNQPLKTGICNFRLPDNYQQLPQWNMRKAPPTGGAVWSLSPEQKARYVQDKKAGLNQEQRGSATYWIDPKKGSGYRPLPAIRPNDYDAYTSASSPSH